MPEYCYPGNPVRLACLIHAASVRSEPESNSQKKLLEFRPGPLTQTSLCSMSLPNPPLAAGLAVPAFDVGLMPVPVAFGINSGFPEVSPARGQVAQALLALPPLGLPHYC